MASRRDAEAIDRPPARLVEPTAATHLTATALSPEAATARSPGRVLALQRQIGNAAVTRALQRAPQRILARDTIWPPGKDDKSGWWKTDDPRELGRRVADDLLSDSRYAGLAAGVVAGGWMLYMVDTVDEIRVKGKLDVLALSATAWPRVAFAMAMVRDPVNFDAARTLALLPADSVPDDQVKEVESRRIDLAMTQFATDRTPLAQAVTAATDDTARKTAMDKLKAFDDLRLPGLEKITASRGAERWKHDQPTVVDAVLAAIELRSMYTALTDLDKVNTDVASRARTGHGASENWCGFFVTDQYRGQSFDDATKALLGAFDSTYRVYAFFTYVYGAVTGRFPKYIREEDGSWEEVAKYHEKRKSKRRWIPTKDLSKENLDIRPGDILTLSVASPDKRKPEDTPEDRAKKEAEMNKEKEYGDHIVMVISYDPATGRLFTIGGNDGGYVVRNGDAPTGESASAKSDREAREAASGRKLALPTTYDGHVGVGFQDLKHQPARGAAGAIVLHTHVAGVGRPSIADFEKHEYIDKLPAPAAKK